MPDTSRQPDSILRNQCVLARTGLSQTTRDRLERAGKFPRRVQLSQRAVGWREADIAQWIKER